MICHKKILLRLCILPHQRKCGISSKNIYQGDNGVNKEKMKTLRGKFEQLQKNEEENIASYFLCVDEIVSTIRGLG